MTKQPIDDLMSGTLVADPNPRPAAPLPFQSPGSFSAKEASDRATEVAVQPRAAEMPAIPSYAGSKPHELLFLEDASIPAILASPALRLAEDDGITLDPKAVSEPLAPRAGVQRLLCRGRPVSADELTRQWAGAARDESGVAPICIVEGELHLALDPQAMLAATVAYVGMLPLAADKRIADALEPARRALDAGAALPDEGLLFASARLSDAIRGVNRDLHRDIDASVTRATASRRRYATRAVLGANHVLSYLDSGGPSVPVYLPEACAERLPLVSSLRVRALATVHGSQDARETMSIALRAIALGRPLSMAI